MIKLLEKDWGFCPRRSLVKGCGACDATRTKIFLEKYIELIKQEPKH